MRHLLALTLCAASLPAATVKGVVVDNLTGRPLARTSIVLEAIRGSEIVRSRTRTDRSGQFTFLSLSAGPHLLTASREGFAPLRYGQKAWNAPAVPIILEQDGTVFLDLRLMRFGVIGGSVLDENDVGFAHVEVMAYREARPPRLVAKTFADERGAYRIGELEPGRYFIRTGPKRLDDGDAILPTLHREAQRVEDAATIEVRMEEQNTDVDVRPVFGRLLRIAGTARVEPPRSVPVTLVSDLGRQYTSTDMAGRFQFENVAPGNYEIFAGLQTLEAAPESTRRSYDRPWTAYERLYLSRDEENLNLPMRPWETVHLAFEGRDGGRIDADSIDVFLRRKDLAGEGPVQKFPSNSAFVPPGSWEILVRPPADLYPVSIAGARAEGWTRIMLRGGSYLGIVLSSRPAAIHGVVTASIGQPAAAAPVYLEPFHPNQGIRLGEIRKALTDAAGAYRFPGLPPGTYRLVSSFEFDDPDEETMTAARPTSVTVKESEDKPQDLELYRRP